MSETEIDEQASYLAKLWYLSSAAAKSRGNRGKKNQIQEEA